MITIKCLCFSVHNFVTEFCSKFPGDVVILIQPVVTSTEVRGRISSNNFSY